MTDQHLPGITTFRLAVAQERQRQLRKWGPQTHTPLEWLAILTEEVGEVAQECCDMWIKGQPIARVLAELIEVAAVAEAAYADLRSQEAAEATKEKSDGGD